jgi:hypothetical protein
VPNRTHLLRQRGIGVVKGRYAYIFWKRVFKHFLSNCNIHPVYVNNYIQDICLGRGQHTKKQYKMRVATHFWVTTTITITMAMTMATTVAILLFFKK